jgi:seryl-tRNA synthetase
MAVVKKIKTVIQFRRDTTQNWLLNKDVVPATGEPCYDIDLKTLKIGDGITTYENLPVMGDGEYEDNSKLRQEVESLRALMESLQADLDNVEEDVSGIQNQVGETDFTEVQASVNQITENVTNLTTQIEETNTEIVTIQQTLENKADADDVTELQTVIEQKVDVETVETLKTDLQTYIDEQIKTVESTSIHDGEI